MQPQRPPAPKIDLIDVHYVEDNVAEPLYAKVKKDQQNIRPERYIPLSSICTLVSLINEHARLLFFGQFSSLLALIRDYINSI